MKTWEFKNYVGYSSCRNNKYLVKKWFYMCENLEDVKKLIAFLYSLEENEILDREIEILVKDINKYGVPTFIDQYYKYRHLGFFCKIVLAS